MPPRAQGIDETIEDMAARYVVALREAQAVGPYRLAGYSGGGVIAFEMAQQLREIGEETERLIFFDALAPHLGSRPVSVWQLLWAARHRGLRDAFGWFGRRRKATAQGDLDGEIRAHLVEGKALPHHLVNHRLNKAYLRAQAAYETSAYDGAVTMFRAKRVSPLFATAGPKLGWEDVLTGEVESHIVNCDHFSMMADPAISEIAERLNDLFALTEANAQAA